MNQIIDQFARLSLTNKIAVLLVTLIAIGVVYYFLGYSPLQENLNKLRDTETDLTEKLMENQAIAKNLEKFREEVSVLDEELKQALALLPNDKDIRSLLRQISVLQKKTNVTNLLFKPASEVRKGFYSEIPIQMKLRGSFHDVAQFFDKVGKLERIVNISEIELSNPKEENGRMILNVNCTATTFKFVGGAGLPSPRKKG